MKPVTVDGMLVYLPVMGVSTSGPARGVIGAVICDTVFEGALLVDANVMAVVSGSGAATCDAGATGACGTN
jgi:hypothetical protein